MVKTIRDFPNYKITDSGEVFNSDGRQIKGEISNSGYARVSLSNDHVKHQKKSVHRLVAEAFIPNPRNLTQVNHINQNKLDNRVENLEWCTPLENLNHSGVIEKASVAKFTKIECVTTGEVFDSVKDAADTYGIHHSNIVACCNGRRSKCGNKQWQYADQEDK